MFVCPVCVDEEWGRSVDRSVGPANDRERDAGTVAGDGPFAGSHIGAGIETAENGRPLQQRSLAGHDVMVEDRRWSEGRLVPVAEEFRLELVVRSPVHLVDGLAEPQIRGRTTVRADDQGGRESFVAPPDDNMARKTVGMRELRAGVMGDDLRGIPTCNGDSQQPPVEGTVVRDDPEIIAAVIDRVLNAFDPRPNGDGLNLRIACWHVPDLARHGRADIDEDEVAAA